MLINNKGSGKTDEAKNTHTLFLDGDCATTEVDASHGGGIALALLREHHIELGLQHLRRSALAYIQNSECTHQHTHTHTHTHLNNHLYISTHHYEHMIHYI